MSLETAIQENTNAIRELIAAIKSGVPTSTAQVAAVVEQGKTETAKAESKATKKTEAGKPTESKATDKPEALTQMNASEAVKALDGHANRPADAPTYQDTADAVTALAKAKGREAAVAIIRQYDNKDGEGKASKLPEIKPEDYAAVIKACNDALNVVEA